VGAEGMRQARRMHDGVVVEGERVIGRDPAREEGADQHHQHDGDADIERLPPAAHAPGPALGDDDPGGCAGVAVMAWLSWHRRHRRAIRGSREAWTRSVTRKTRETRMARVSVSPWITG